MPMTFTVQSALGRMPNHAGSAAFARASVAWAVASISSSVLKCIAASLRSRAWICAKSVVPSTLPPSSLIAARMRLTSSSPSWWSSVGVLLSEVWTRMSLR